MKILACDFDGTLYQNKRISDHDISNIQRWQKQGNLFVFATGRDINSINYKLEGTAFSADYIIGNNGATIGNDSITYLMNDDVLRLLKVTDLLQFEAVNLSYLDTNSGGKHVEIVKAERLNFTTIEALLKTANVSQISFKSISTTHAEEFVYSTQTDYPHMVFFQNVEMIDIVASGTDKSKAVRALADELKVNHEDIYAIGDGLNDYKMLQRFTSATFPWVASDLSAVSDYQVESVGEWIVLLEQLTK